jgi:phage terminase large subunit
MTATAKPKLKVNGERFNSAYRPLFDNKAEFLHFCGGAGSGKSRFVAQREILKSFNRVNCKTLVVRKVFNTLKDSCYSELKTVIYEFGLEKHFSILRNPVSITNKTSNVEFLFRGFDDPEKIKSVTIR